MNDYLNRDSVLEIVEEIEKRLCPSGYYYRSTFGDLLDIVSKFKELPSVYVENFVDNVEKG